VQVLGQEKEKHGGKVVEGSDIKLQDNTFASLPIDNGTKGPFSTNVNN
jgi:hypothetical protein